MDLGLVQYLHDNVEEGICMSMLIKRWKHIQSYANKLARFQTNKSNFWTDCINDFYELLHLDNKNNTYYCKPLNQANCHHI